MAKFFFLNIGFTAIFYTIISSFLFLVFSIIDYKFIDRIDFIYFNPPFLRLAIIFVLTPILILLKYFINIEIKSEPSRKESKLVQWISYFTIFISAIVIISDLVIVSYYFFSGKDITLKFILKSLTIFIISGFVIGYYYFEIKNRLTFKQEKFVGLFFVFLMYLTIFYSFLVFGTPSVQRKIRIDNQRISHLQNIQGEIKNYFINKGKLPESLNEISSFSSFVIPKDPITQEEYQYRKIDDLNYELCANFYLENYTVQVPFTYTNEDWRHPAGKHCFQRKINPAIDKPIIPKD